MVQTWDSGHKNANVTLSNGNLTATKPTNSLSYSPFFGTTGKTSGKWYWEITATQPAGDHNGIGIGNTASVTTDGQWVGLNTTTVGYFKGGNFWYNGASVVTMPAYATPATLCFALDMDNHKLWARVSNGNWNNAAIGSQNPATNTGGYTLNSAVYASAVVPAANLYTITTETVVAAFASASWGFSAPSGFGEFDPVVAPFPPWPPPSILQLGA